MVGTRRRNGAVGAGVLALALCAGLASPLPARAQGNRVAEIATYQGADREQRLIEGAKREKELTFYSSIPIEDIAALVTAFDKKYGVKVKVWRADSEALLQRVLNEFEGPPLRCRRRGRLELGARAALPREPAAGGEVTLSRRPPAASDAEPRPVGADLSQCFRAGLQHQLGEEGKPAQDLSGPAQARMEGEARHRSRGFRLVRPGGDGARRDPGVAVVPRDCRDQRHIGAQGPYPAEQLGGGGRGAAGAHHLHLGRRADQAQGRAARLVRASARGRAAERRGRRAQRAASVRSYPVLRFPDQPGAADPGEPPIRPGEPEDRNAAQPQPAQAHRFRA